MCHNRNWQLIGFKNSNDVFGYSIILTLKIINDIYVKADQLVLKHKLYTVLHFISLTLILRLILICILTESHTQTVKLS